MSYQLYCLLLEQVEIVKSQVLTLSSQAKLTENCSSPADLRAHFMVRKMKYQFITLLNKNLLLLCLLKELIISYYKLLSHSVGYPPKSSWGDKN